MNDIIEGQLPIPGLELNPKILGSKPKNTTKDRIFYRIDKGEFFKHLACSIMHFKQNKYSILNIKFDADASPVSYIFEPMMSARKVTPSTVLENKFIEIELDSPMGKLIQSVGNTYGIVHTIDIFKK